MRSSLENIEFIENYILGNLDPSERESAKLQIDGSPELTSLFETQQCIYSATKRRALRSEIQSYAPIGSTSFFKQYRNWFIGGLSVIGIVGLFAIYQSSTSEIESEKSSQIQSRNQAQLAANEQDVTPWIPFDVQSFPIVAENGATIVGKNGTLIVLGANSLIDAKGNRVKGKVSAELIEALDWEDMIAYNLTTTSDGKALSSGGMIRIRYNQNGEEVFVDPAKPMHIEIPTDDYNPDMKVWEGEVKNDQLNWKNPQEIGRYLTKIDLKHLNFLPSGFDAEVTAILPYKGHQQLSDRLVDSLYYSIGTSGEMYTTDKAAQGSFVNDCYFNIPRREDIGGHPLGQTRPLMKGKVTATGQIVDPNGKPIAGMDVILRMDRYLEHDEVIRTDKQGYFTFNKFYSGDVAVYASLHSEDTDDVLWKYCLETSFTIPRTVKKFTLKKPLVAESTSMINFEKLSVAPKTGGCFIDPLSIKTLKSNRFQNTFIATKEFETRLQAMHLLKKGTVVFETYLRNLAEPLWKCDQFAADLLSGEEKAIFQAFADQRLTNVENDGIHQSALLRHFTEQRKAFKAEKRKQIASNQQKTSQELRKLSQSLEETMNNPEKIAQLRAESKGKTNSSNAKKKPVSSREITGSPTRSSYKFSWFSSSWINIDCYLMELGPTPWITAIKTNRNDRNLKVFQCIRESNTVIGLTANSGKYEARFPQKGNQPETFSLAMLKEDDQLFFAQQSYNPVSDRAINLDLAPISEDDFYLQLCLLAPKESSIAKNLKSEHSKLRSKVKINETMQSFTSKLNATRNKISEEVVVYNRLFDALNRCAEPVQ